MIILPRQARDKHKKNSKKVPFSCRKPLLTPDECTAVLEEVRKNALSFSLSVSTATILGLYVYQYRKKRSLYQDRLRINV
eukprot:COSAG06_NODE_11382_length_1518_cov_1.950669_1_plen_80_part_00